MAVTRAFTALPPAGCRNNAGPVETIAIISNLLCVRSEEATIRGSRGRSGQTAPQARGATEITDLENMNATASIVDFSCSVVPGTARHGELLRKNRPHKLDRCHPDAPTVSGRN